MPPPPLNARHWLIDLDGVLYKGHEPLPGAVRFIAWLRERGCDLRLVTNNATLRPEQYVEKLAAMGIQVQSEEVFTSALATALYLRDQTPRPTSAFVIGETGLVSALESIGIRVTDKRPEYVVVGLDRNLTYDTLATAALAIRLGARFVGSNPDRSLPSERGLLPGAGAILAALEATTGVTPVVVGKPQPLMLRLAMGQLGGSPTDTVMLGDQLDTDIEGARAAGVPSIMVLTGVSTREDAQRSEIQPDLVVEGLSVLMEAADSDA